jgi:hypothetical protein
MRHVTRALLIAATFALPSAVIAQEAPPRPKPAQLPKDSMEIGRKYSQWLFTNSSDSLVAHMELGNKDPKELKTEIDQRALQIASRAGTESKVLEEKYITRNGMRQYWRTSEFSNFSEPLVLRFIISEKGQILGHGFGPKSQTPPIDP